MHMYTFTESYFENATVSSLVVVFKKEQPTGDVLITKGSRMAVPDEKIDIQKNDLETDKWLKLFNVKSEVNIVGQRLGDFVDVKRGIATGNNAFFIKELPRNIAEDNMLSIPVYDPKLFLNKDTITDANVNVFKHVLYTRLDREVIGHKYPNLEEYLKWGEDNDIDKKYITSHRKVWYQQEIRKSPDYIFGNIFNAKRLERARFVKVDTDRIIATNSFLLIYLKPEFKNMKDILFDKLTKVPHSQFLEIGRVYGGGMVKVEPKELLELRI